MGTFIHNRLSGVNKKEIARLGRGEFFGEKAAISGDASDVTVTALDDLELLILGKNALHSLLDRTPPPSREIGSVMEARRQALRGVRRINRS